MIENICHFIPFHKDSLSVHTINFVYETKFQRYDGLKAESVYKIYYVCSGEGFIHTPGKITKLSAGDIFFTFPASYFAIDSKHDFTYMYISFVGLRGNMIMEKLRISNSNFVFNDMSEVYDFWNKALNKKSNAMDLISESVLLYTFSALSDKILMENNESKQHQSVNVIKKYLDDNFTDQNFSLEKMSSELSYNKKYISSLFKKHFGFGIVEYINTIRIQNACTLIKQEFTSVSDIALRCGYSDAQYFSKIFKTKMGVTPTQYISTIQAENKAR